MATKSWVLTDVAEGTYHEAVSLSGAELGELFADCRITKSTLRGGLSDGVDVVEVNNGRLRYVVVPTRGMNVWQARLGDLHLGWRSPTRGPVHPALVRLTEPSGLGWLDGFDELVARCGLESNGAPEFNEDGTLRYGLHGKISNRPACKVTLEADDYRGTISLTGEVYETRLFFSKLRLTSTITTRVDEPSFTITDTVTNLSAEAGDMQLLYHINFGKPLLEPGSKVVLPVRRAAPRDAVAVDNLEQWDTYGPETPGSTEAVFFFQLVGDASGRYRTLLQNGRGDQGVSVLFNRDELPCFTLWKNQQAADDGYVTGLEPATNYPNGKSFEKAKGRVVELAPGESRSFHVTVEGHPDAEAVEAARAEVLKLQGDVIPEICSQPDPEWSAS